MFERIVRHYRGYLQKTPWTFCWHAALEGTVLGLLAGLLVWPLIRDNPQEELMKYPAPVVFMLIVLIAPLLETLLLQALPVFVVRRFKARWFYQFLAGLLPFALTHLTNGFSSFIAAGLVGGSYFSFCYVHWRQRSRWTATWTTMAQHAIHNGIAFAILLASGELGAA
jgi:hypothetical protein